MDAEKHEQIKMAFIEEITINCKKVNTYRGSFDPVIETLAEILTDREETRQQYNASGGNPIIAHTNARGATNLEQNPAARRITELNTQALAYWRELGLTPKSLRALNDELLKGGNKPDDFGALIAGLLD